MPVRSYSHNRVCTAQPDETLRSAAQRMEAEGTGSLIVIEDGHAIGVVTDRDIVLRAVAARRNPDKAQVRDAIERKAVTIGEHARLPEATDLMRAHRLRRLPLVDTDEKVVGMIAADDVVRLLAEEIVSLARVATAQMPAGVSTGIGAAGAAAAGLKAPPAVRIAEHYQRDVVCMREDTNARALADTMKHRSVGCVVATSDGEDVVGIVTDRDIVLRVVAAGRDPDATPVSAIMSTPPITAATTQPLEEVVAIMSNHGVRRLPILKGDRAVGLVSYDDLLVAFGREFVKIGEIARAEVHQEQHTAQAEHLRQEIEKSVREIGGKAAALGIEAVESLRSEIDNIWERIRRR